MDRRDLVQRVDLQVIFGGPSRVYDVWTAALISLDADVLRRPRGLALIVSFDASNAVLEPRSERVAI